MILFGYFQIKMNKSIQNKYTQSEGSSSSILIENLINIKNVYSFGYEQVVLDNYKKSLNENYQHTIKRAKITGFIFGLGQLFIFISLGLLLFMGALFLRDI